VKKNYWNKKPSSFAETVQLVENYVQAEIRQETKDKQLFYHSLDHALAVKSRASSIFQAIKSFLAQEISAAELKRLEDLINLSALAHDMVQLFDPSTPVNQSRKRLTGLSETETANKLLKYIQDLNRQLTTSDPTSAILFSDRDQQIIQDAIAATVCQHNSQVDIANDTFSAPSIYQPYLYQSQPKISIVGSIIALADLGTLGMEGADQYIQDGILIFLEDNPNYEGLIMDCNSQKYEPKTGCDLPDKNLVRNKLLTMAQFMVSFAHDRKARFEWEISGFSPQVRQTLRDQVFIYLSQETISQIEAVIPTHQNASLAELIDFFYLPKIGIN